MKALCLLLLASHCVLASTWAQTKPDTMQHHYTFLALGDSYTVGEGLPLHKSFPYQTVSLLRKAGYSVSAPEIVAKTGWTTDELEAAVSEHTFLPKYDFVSLLIGVNNQYRGRDIIEYKEQFERLLKRAIDLAGGRPEHVVIVSIPDYGLTPYGQKLDTGKIAREIDAYNSLNRALSVQFKTLYADVTELSRTAGSEPGAVTADGLHPSEKEYAKWAKLVVQTLKPMLKKS